MNDPGVGYGHGGAPLGPLPLAKLTLRSAGDDNRAVQAAVVDSHNSAMICPGKNDEGRMADLNAWDSFYVVVGSAAGALIGLQFVVMTLIAEKPMAVTAEAGRAFATPTIIHFCCVLLISALIQVPLP